jgi:hypothetical protein
MTPTPPTPNRAVLGLCLMLAALDASAKAQAPQTDLERYLLQNHYGPVETQSGDTPNEQTFDARINGKGIHFVVDTGACPTCITADSARRLGLTVHDTGKTDWGVGGEMSGQTGMAPITTFTINDWNINRMSTIAVLPTGAYLQEDGLFGLDALSLNAAIFPVGGRGFLIKPGATPIVSIAGYMQGLGFTPVPLKISRNRLIVSGSLDNQPFVALIDSGASYTLFETELVDKVHAQDRLWTYVSMEGIDGRRIHTWQFVPRQFSLGALKITPQVMLSQTSPILQKEKFDALIGFDFLAQHRAVIDLGYRILWLK